MSGWQEINIKLRIIYKYWTSAATHLLWTWGQRRMAAIFIGCHTKNTEKCPMSHPEDVLTNSMSHKEHWDVNTQTKDTLINSKLVSKSWLSGLLLYFTYFVYFFFINLVSSESSFLLFVSSPTTDYLNIGFARVFILGPTSLLLSYIIIPIYKEFCNIYMLTTSKFLFLELITSGSANRFYIIETSSISQKHLKLNMLKTNYLLSTCRTIHFIGFPVQ